MLRFANIIDVYILDKVLAVVNIKSFLYVYWKIFMSITLTDDANCTTEL